MKALNTQPWMIILLISVSEVFRSRSVKLAHPRKYLYPEMLIPFIHYGPPRQCLLYVVGHLEKEEGRKQAKVAFHCFHFVFSGETYRNSGRTNEPHRRTHCLTLVLINQVLKTLNFKLSFTLATTDEDVNDYNLIDVRFRSYTAQKEVAASFAPCDLRCCLSGRSVHLSFLPSSTL